MDHRSASPNAEEFSVFEMTAAMHPDRDTQRLAYIRRLLSSYRRTPGTCGRTRRPDRDLARRLYERNIPLQIAEAAFLLAASRRLFRPANAPPLNSVRSLSYFLPVIEELIAKPPDPAYIRYLKRKLEQPR